ncbi:hypothetical protein PI124_g20837 [Phytophthora idaei]|nr:hypothetical protein PI125_g22686 [Phytophthora idaei]KAG3125539.1 hypothetical protein PI126_g22720 [Phytophthora idaei]KAG3234108.1 hypothetical protein PI124_g20837 [Phytophthora idaei]
MAAVPPAASAARQTTTQQPRRVGQQHVGTATSDDGVWRQSSGGSLRTTILDNDDGAGTDDGPDRYAANTADATTDDERANEQTVGRGTDATGTGVGGLTCGHSATGRG